MPPSLTGRIRVPGLNKRMTRFGIETPYVYWVNLLMQISTMNRR